MKPMPHASFSLAGSYSPTFFGAVVTPAVRCASADMAPTHGAKSPASLLSDRSSANLFVEMASLAKCHARGHALRCEKGKRMKSRSVCKKAHGFDRCRCRKFRRGLELLVLR